MLEKLQYISQGTTVREQEINIKKALQQGAGWVQIRWKNAGKEELKKLCIQAKSLCVQYNAVFIINDDPLLAKEMDADGVHLGLDDMSISEARSILGSEKIIGGTANTTEDIVRRVKEGCDYIGLGPFRFTRTKEKLSPILGLEGYESIIRHFKESDIALPPIIAIGGITVSDIAGIIETGIYGVAISGEITQNENAVTRIKSILL